MHQQHLASEDETLIRLFEGPISSRAWCEDTDWDTRVIRVLIEGGYTVRARFPGVC
jgi:hypothetical protein